MYSSPNQPESLTNIQVRDEISALHAAGYCHDGDGNWSAPDSNAFYPREEAYQQLMEWG